MARRPIFLVSFNGAEFLCRMKDGIPAHQTLKLYSSEIPDRPRDRKAHALCPQAQPLRTSRRDHDPGHLSSRTAGLGGVRSPMALRAAISLQTTGTIPEPCSTISATRTSSTPSATPSFHPTGSATSGEISLARFAASQTSLMCVRQMRPPVGGLLNSENCSCPLSQKPAQKRFLPQKGGSLSDGGRF